MKRELSLEDIKFLHFMNRIPASRIETPVVGFYHILEELPSNYKDDFKHLNGYLYSAYYHPTQPDFKHRFKVKVLVWALRNNISIGPKECVEDQLIDAVLNIEEFASEGSLYYDPATNKSKESTCYRAVWDIIEYRTAEYTYSNNQNINEQSIDEIQSEEFDESLDELELLLLAADIEMIDEETELVFWEANQPNWGMSEAEVEILLDQADDDELNAN